MSTDGSHRLSAGKKVTKSRMMRFAIRNGMDARKIVAVNTDANAPIFRIAHYRLVGDLKVIVSVVIPEKLSEEQRNLLIRYAEISGDEIKAPSKNKKRFNIF